MNTKETLMVRSTIEMRQVSRRELIATCGAGFVAAMGLSLIPGSAFADAKSTEDAMMKAIGGKKPTMGKIKLDLPEIAENGNTVPIGLEVESPMTASDYPKAVHVFAENNPTPDVASFNFTPACGRASVSTRIRMAKTQNIIAVAEMSDGSVFMGKKEVKVTIGGCGG